MQFQHPKTKLRAMLKSLFTPTNYTVGILVLFPICKNPPSYMYNSPARNADRDPPLPTPSTPSSMNQTPTSHIPRPTLSPPHHAPTFPPPSHLPPTTLPSPPSPLPHPFISKEIQNGILSKRLLIEPRTEKKVLTQSIIRYIGMYRAGSCGRSVSQDREERDTQTRHTFAKALRTREVFEQTTMAFPHLAHSRHQNTRSRFKRNK